jgi:hypothetical protein
MVRIEMQLTEEEVAIIEQIAKEESRSRKKQCEVYIRKMISDYKRKRSLATNGGCYISVAEK